MILDWNNLSPEEAKEALSRHDTDKRRYNTRSMLRGKKIKWALTGNLDLFSSQEEAAYWDSMANLLRSWAEEDPWIKDRLEKVELT